ncbi:MAG: FMN-binding protein [Nakamurella sp.]
MKKIVLWFATTVSIVVLLFGYRTSTNATNASAATSAQRPYVGTATAGGTAGSGTAGSSTGKSGTAGSSTGKSGTAGSGTGNAVTAPASPSTSTAANGSTAATSASSPASASTTTTYTGRVASTRWGDVQVAITVTDGKISAVSVPVYPSGNGEDQQINAVALPILVQETVSNQSANIDMVSGATVTSNGYLTSLQSALDQAGL